MTGARSARRVALLGAAAAAALAWTGPARAADPFGPCPARTDVECATITVPLDRGGVVPGQVALHVERVRTSGARRGTLVVLVGGPGQAASDVRDGLRADLAGPAQGRDLILLDQRGTGLSGVLACRSFATAGRGTPPDVVVAGCAAEIGPARDLYTTLQSALDIEDVRAAIGAETLSVYGVSYGTRVAAEYARRFPARVESLVLDSVVPPDGSDPFRRATLTAAGPALDALCRGGRCAGITRTPAGDLARLARRTAGHPLRGTFVDDRGRPHPLSLTGDDLFDLLLAGDLDPSVRAGIPAAVRSALGGDTAPLMRIAGRQIGGGAVRADIAPALFLATICGEEPVPWDRAATPEERARQRDAALAALPAASLGGFGAVVASHAPVLDLCLRWPAPAVAPSPPPPLPDVPVLLLSGREDVRTPPSDARAVSALFPRARLVEVPGVAHAVLANDPSGCAGRAMTAFLSGAEPSPCTRARRVIAPFSLPPRSVATLRAARGVPGLAGRTLTAWAATLEDVSQTAFLAGLDAPRTARTLRAGGLRGGSFTATGRSLRLTRVVYVPGVEVSGRTVRGGSVWTIGGPDAARGTLTLSGDHLTGTLGGVAIDRRGSG